MAKKKKGRRSSKHVSRHGTVKAGRRRSAPAAVVSDKDRYGGKSHEVKKLKFGIGGFDALFKQGIPQGSSVLIEGGPGSGKTILSLQIAYHAAKKGLKTLYMSFEEPEHRLRSHMSHFGWHPEKLEQKGLFRLKRFNSLDIARSVEALLSEAKKELLIEIQPVLIPKDFRPDIVCIDSLSSIASAFSGEESRFRVYMEQLFRYLEGNGITAFLIREVANPVHIGLNYVEKGEAVSFLSDGIIIMYNVVYPTGKRARAIEILKMRGEDIQRKIVEAKIGSHGVKVYPNKLLKGRYQMT
jgi:circadian clock protein KaiC